jgi:hypothetical protein
MAPACHETPDESSWDNTDDGIDPLAFMKFVMFQLSTYNGMRWTTARNKQWTIVRIPQSGTIDRRRNGSTSSDKSNVFQFQHSQRSVPYIDSIPSSIQRSTVSDGFCHRSISLSVIVAQVSSIPHFLLRNNSLQYTNSVQ